MHRSGLLLIVIALAWGCEARPSRQVSAAQLDKQAMFGSASLVPTREGERARRELAIAGELEQALAQLRLGAAHVVVELRDPVTVIVIATRPPEHDAEQAERVVRQLAHALVPELEPGNLHLWLQPVGVQQPTPQPGTRTWLLMLACLGLGVSLGIGGERLRSR